MEMKWFAIIIIAIVIEGVVEYLKISFPSFAESRWVIVTTILLGVGVAIAYDADMLAVAGLSAKIPYVGNILTGIIMARGSNYLYDIIGKYTEAQTEYDDLIVSDEDKEIIESREENNV